MSRESMLTILGALIIVSPFSGFPLSWLMWFHLATGLFVLALGVSLRLGRMRATRPSRESIHEQPSSALS